MKIAIIGYGEMGRAVKFAADEKKIEVSHVFDIDNPIDENGSYDFDVAIDFSSPTALIKNLLAVSALNKNIVIGATGWDFLFEQVRTIVANNGIGCVYASNFSIGMKIFNSIVKQAAIDFNEQSSLYDVFIHEFHHRNKIDSPSGTGITLAKSVLNGFKAKKSIFTERADGKLPNDALHLSSTRGGAVFGKHSLYFDSAFDTIELSHTAKNRMGFAFGALAAAEWIDGKFGLFDFAEI